MSILRKNYSKLEAHINQESTGSVDCNPAVGNIDTGKPLAYILICFIK